MSLIAFDGAQESLSPRLSASSISALRLGHVRRERLLRIDVLAGEKGGARHIDVALDAGEVDDDADFGVGEKRLIARVGLEPVSLSRDVPARAVTVGHALENQSGVPRPGRHVMVENVAAADHANLHIRVPSLLRGMRRPAMRVARKLLARTPARNNSGRRALTRAEKPCA